MNSTFIIEYADMLLSRAEYDAMIAAWPFWMQYTWPSYDRSWSLAGVRVTASTSRIGELAEKLEFALGR